MSAQPRSRDHAWQIDATGVGVCLGLSLLFYWAGVEPLSRQRATHLEAQAELGQRQDKAMELANAADELQRRLKEVGQAVDDAPVQLKPVQQLNQRLAHLTRLASECGLAIDQTQHDRPHGGQWYQTVPINLSGQGAYPTCAVFLDRLRRTYPDMGVSSFELSREPGGEVAAKFRFDLVWYTAPALDG